MNTSNAINTLELNSIHLFIPDDKVLDHFSSNYSMSLEANELIQYHMTEHIIKNYIWDTVYNSMVITTNEDNIKYLPPKQGRGRGRARKKTI